MSVKQRKLSWISRPQVCVLTAVCAVLVVGWWFTDPPLMRPTMAAGAVLQAYRGVPAALVPDVASPPEVDCAIQACLALTFDDGPDGDFTPPILDTLQRHRVRATFFVLGPHAERHPDLIRREFQSGHEIGNHSWSHTDFTKLTPTQIRDEISRTQQVISAAGVPPPTLFRPPYGATNDVVLANVPLTVARWSIDPEDWKAKQPGPIIDSAMAHAKPGGVIILHDTEQMTTEALDALLTNLEPHYQFVTMSELLNLPPGQQGVYYAR